MNLVVIPYRNREEHLDYFIENLAPLLKKHLDNLKIVVVEQGNNKKFNRGKVLNVGVKEYINVAKFIFLHDVDIIPNENIIINLYKNESDDIVRIFNGNPTSLGGITKFKTNILEKINGFRNDMWGWGFEDEVLFYRAIICNISMQNLQQKKQNFTFLKHGGGKGNHPKHIMNYRTPSYINSLTVEEKMKSVTVDGLNTVSYTVIERKEINDYIEILKVDI